MTTDGLGLLFGSFHRHPDEEKECALGDFTPEEKELYSSIVNKLTHHFSKPRSDSQDYSVIFRQSKSWRNVEKMFNDILAEPTIIKVKNWAINWLKEIELLRIHQNSINDLIVKLDVCKSKFQEIENPKTHPRSIEMLTKRKALLKKEIQEIRQEIIISLNQKQNQLSTPDLFLKKNSSCQKIIKYLNDNWDQLKLFNDWAEVSLDEEKIFVQVRESANFVQNNQFPNKSIKAIFLIGEISPAPKIPLEHDKEGKTIRPTKIDVKKFHLASSSPGTKKCTPSIQLTDELIFDFPLLPPSEEENQKTVSETALKLERIVQLAIKSINQKITANTESSTPQINRFFFSFFPINLMFDDKKK